MFKNKSTENNNSIKATRHKNCKSMTNNNNNNYIFINNNSNRTSQQK